MIICIKLYATPVVFFIKTGENIELSKKIKSCNDFKIEGFTFRNRDFSSKNIANIQKNIKKAAKRSTNLKIRQILCLHSKHLNGMEKDFLKKELKHFYDFLNQVLGYYKNWLSSNTKKNFITLEDEKIIPKFIKTKQDLYTLLWGRDVEWYFFKEKTDKNNRSNLENDYFPIYLSLYKLQYEFYYSISKKYREELLKARNGIIGD